MDPGNRFDDELPNDVKLLLSEIEQEPVPDRLLDLATKLQNALAKRRERAVRTIGNSEDARE